MELKLLIIYSHKSPEIDQKSFHKILLSYNLLSIRIKPSHRISDSLASNFTLILLNFTISYNFGNMCFQHQVIVDGLQSFVDSLHSAIPKVSRAIIQSQKSQSIFIDNRRLTQWSSGIAWIQRCSSCTSSLSMMVYQK